MQLSPMKAELRVVVSSKPAARFLVDQLSPAVEELADLVLDGHCLEPFEQTERRKFPSRVRQKRDPHADFLDLWGAFIDAGADATSLEPNRETEPCNTAAHNDYFHNRTALRCL